MQAIITKYLPATDLRGSRVKATCERGSVTIGYPYERGPGEDAHRAACEALVEKFDAEDRARFAPVDPGYVPTWGSLRWVCGGLPATSGFAFVPVPVLDSN
jgi:hypothetical protein